MKRTKLKKFAEIKELPNVFDQDSLLKQDWKTDIFKNQNPLYVELACGSAKFSIQMAQNSPNINFVAMDRKGERIWLGAKEALSLGLTNLYFFQGNIKYIEKEFKPNSIDELWITFPDPFPKPKNTRQRLTHRNFLDKYKILLSPTGTINLKTDFKLLLEFTEQEILDLNGNILQKEIDIYERKNSLPAHLFYQTFFEKMHLDQGKKIHYLKGKL